jgi:uncharacterized protein (DUF4415 family)
MSARLTKKAHSELLAAIGRSLSAELQQQLRDVAAMPEDQINTDDIPEVRDWSDAVRGKFYRPLKRQLTLRVDADVVDWFQSQAPKGGYQTEMNRVLRDAMVRGRRRRARVAAGQSR